MEKFHFTKGTSQNYNWWNFPEFQIPNDKLILEDVPDPNHCSLDQINAFALTFNAYNDEEFKFKPGSGNLCWKRVLKKNIQNMKIIKTLLNI